MLSYKLHKPCHQSFASTRRSKQENAPYMFHPCKHLSIVTDQKTHMYSETFKHTKAAPHMAECGQPEGIWAGIQIRKNTNEKNGHCSCPRPTAHFSISAFLCCSRLHPNRSCLFYLNTFPLLLAHLVDGVLVMKQKTWQSVFSSIIIIIITTIMKHLLHMNL